MKHRNVILSFCAALIVWLSLGGPSFAQESPTASKVSDFASAIHGVETLADLPDEDKALQIKSIERARKWSKRRLPKKRAFQN